MSIVMPENTNKTKKLGQLWSDNKLKNTKLFQ